MPMITDIPLAPQAATVAASGANLETWVCEEGVVQITLEPVSASTAWVTLTKGAGYPVPAGATVSYRRLGRGDATIARLEWV